METVTLNCTPKCESKDDLSSIHFSAGEYTYCIPVVQRVIHPIPDEKDALIKKLQDEVLILAKKYNDAVDLLRLRS